MKKHTKYVHLNIKDFVCNSCNTSYKSSRALRKHVLRIHEGKSPKRNYKCETCHNTFLTKHDLKSHSESVHEGKQHICETCNESFIKNLSCLGMLVLQILGVRITQNPKSVLVSTRSNFTSEKWN